MEEMVLLAVAVVLRALGAASRQGGGALAARFVGWLTSAAGAWLVAGAAGAWAPVWPALLIGFIGALPSARRQVLPLWIVGDATIVVAAGMLSVPVLGLDRMAVAAAAACGLGLGADRLARKVGQIARQGTLVATAAICVGGFAAATVAAIDRAGMAPAPALWRLVMATTGLTTSRVPGAERIVLEGGAVAWLDRPAGPGPFPGALHLHGANPRGAEQPAALVLRRALVEAGFVVLSVNHIGYAGGPIPPEGAPEEAWDTLPVNQAALCRLSRMADVGRLLVVGHSAGGSEALRMLASGPSPNGAVMFGASATRPPEEDEYWYGRFHTDRGLMKRLPRDLVRGIRDRNHDADSFAKALPENHAPILFVTFGIEWPDVRELRDPLYEMIAGAKEVWRLDRATHYFSTWQGKALLIGDTSVGRELAAGLEQFAERVGGARTADELCSKSDR